MYRIRQDQRTIRSSQMIYQALATLIREKPFNKITVTNVVEAAQVGRTTFYRCFDGLEDVLRMRCDQVFEELTAYIFVYLQEGGMGERNARLKPMLRYFYLNSEIIDLLLLAKRMDILKDSFRVGSQAIQQQAAQQLQLEDNYIAYLAEIRISVILSIVTQWVKTGKREAPDELADKLKAMLRHMITVNQMI